jgi:4-hydroxy-tetrahydrodipicolinate reductase
MIKICVSGCCGKMGKRICELAMEDSEIKLISGIERKNHPDIGKSIFDKTNAIIFDDIKKAIKNVNVLIEFSTPEATIEHLENSKEEKISFVIGTTGFSQNQFNKIKEFSSYIPIFISPNMSFGVNVIFKICQELTKLLKDYEIEIVELHHNKKIDSPSGTAQKIADLINNVKEEKSNFIYGRKGKIGPRKKEELGIHSLRLGDIIGEHQILFAGKGERIELIHRAQSRDIFALGALKAAKFIKDKSTGIYSMQDLVKSI